MILSTPCQSHKDGDPCILNVRQTQAPFPLCSFESFHLSIIECGREAESTQDTVRRQSLSWNQALYLPLTVGLLPGIVHRLFHILIFCLFVCFGMMKGILTSYLSEESRRSNRAQILIFSFCLSCQVSSWNQNTTVEWRQHLLRVLGLKLYFPWETGPLWETWPLCSYIQHVTVLVSPRKCHIDSTVATHFLHRPVRKGKNEKTPTGQREFLPSPPLGLCTDVSSSQTFI